MLLYVIRRLLQSALTVFGVMLITFVLFRQVSGDLASAWTSDKASAAQKADWRISHGYNKPLIADLHRSLVIADHSKGDGSFMISDTVARSDVVNALELVRSSPLTDGPTDHPRQRGGQYESGQSFWADRETSLDKLTDKARPLVKDPPKPQPPAETQPADTQPADTQPGDTQPATAQVPTQPVATEPAATDPTQTAPPDAQPTQDDKPQPPLPGLKIETFSGDEFTVDLQGVATLGDVIDRINNAPGNDGKVVAGISQWSAGEFFDSQFFDHLYKSVTFSGRSLKNNKKLTEIISERAPASLAITIPAMAIGWLASLAIASFVAYYRGKTIDKLGVFFSVLGMCIPMLAWVVYGQWAMSLISPVHAHGIDYKVNVYLPIAIVVVAGLGGSVRFYRTIILDETNRDYVRTARAKGVGLTGILFKHVIRNCMLPIMTNLIMAIPFLMLGSLLVEQYFAIPGLGGLMIQSFNNRDEPLLNGLVFLTALIYTLSVLVTDLSYAFFDPRVRLQ